MERAEWSRERSAYPDRALKIFPPGSGISPTHYWPDVEECKRGFESRLHGGPIQTEFEYWASSPVDPGVPAAVVFEECGTCNGRWQFGERLTGTIPPVPDWMLSCRTTGIERGIRIVVKTHHSDQVLRCDVPYTDWSVALGGAWVQCFLVTLAVRCRASVVEFRAWLLACQTCIEDRYEWADGLYRLKRPAESRH